MAVRSSPRGPVERHQKLSVVLLGRNISGKTCIYERYLRQKFIVDPMFTFSCQMEVIDRPLLEGVTIYLWDNSGHDRFDDMNRSFIKLRSRALTAYVLVYSIDHAESFQKAHKLADFLKKDCCQPVSDYPILVLGNKCDLVNQRMVSRESGEELAASIGARFFEVSAATGKNMEESLSALLELYLEKRDKFPPPPPPPPPPVNQSDQEAKAASGSSSSAASGLRTFTAVKQKFKDFRDQLEVMMKSTTPLPSVRCSERHIPQFSVLILGGLMCGKTCIYTRYLRQEFAGDTGPTLGCRHEVLSTPLLEGEKICLWDTCGYDFAEGSNRMFIIMKNFMKAFVLVYAIDDVKSIQKAQMWADLIKDCRQPVTDYPILVLGNKCDLVNQRVVSRESGEELAASIGARFFEVSAATGKNMEESLSALVELYLEKRDKFPPPPPPPVNQSDEAKVVSGSSSGDDDAATSGLWTFTAVKQKLKDFCDRGMR